MRAIRSLLAVGLSFGCTWGLSADARADGAVDEPADGELEEEVGPPAPQAEPLPGAPRKPGPARVKASADEGFRLESGDGRFGFSLGILGQVRFRVDEGDDRAEPRFSLQLARTMIQGNLWGNRVQWQIQPEFAGQARLLDANATINLHPALSFLVGQYRPWFTRGFPTNLPIQALPDRGQVLDSFRIDRDIGVTVMGQPFDGRMEYYVGVLNGEGPAASMGPYNPQPLVTARLVGAPLGGLGYNQTQATLAGKNLPWRFAFAANVATVERSREGITVDPVTGATDVVGFPDRRTLVVGGDVAVQGWRLSAMGEGFWRRNWDEVGSSPSEAGDAWGAYGLVTGVIIRKRLDISTRVGALRLEDEPGTHMPIEPGLSIYVFGDHGKFQLRYRCDVDVGGGGCLSQGGDLQAQLWF